jgi:hypothetical protein
VRSQGKVQAEGTPPAAGIVVRAGELLGHQPLRVHVVADRGWIDLGLGDPPGALGFRPFLPRSPVTVDRGPETGVVAEPRVGFHEAEERVPAIGWPIQ